MSLSKLFKLYHLCILHIKFKLYGVKCGKKVRGNRVVFKNEGSIQLGNEVSLNSYPAGELYNTGLRCYLNDSKITIGDKTILNGTWIYCRTSVTIGSYCLFGPGTKIVDNDSHRISLDAEERRKAPISKPIRIENNVWLGMNSLVLKGVKIGENSIVAANSVVTKDVPSNVLIAGNPAKIIKKLI